MVFIKGHPVPKEWRDNLSLRMMGNKQGLGVKHKLKDNAAKSTGWIRAERLFPCPEGFERHHIDGNPLNNDPNNVQIVTHKEHIRLDGRIKNLRNQMR